MPPSSVPELQQKLFKRMGLEVPDIEPNRKTKHGQHYAHQMSRKEQRKAHRVQKKTHIYSRAFVNDKRNRPTAKSDHGPSHPSKKWPIASKTTKQDEMEDDDNENDIDDQLTSGAEEGSMLDEESEELDDPFDDDEDEEEIAEKAEDEEQLESHGRRVSQAVQAKLAQDDAEIDEFERKLGIKKGRKSLPQAFKDDGLDELMADFDEGAPDESDEEDRKRKREYEGWLASKRKNPAQPKGEAMNEERDSAESDEDEDMDDFDDDDFDGFDSEPEGPVKAQVQQRENPYVAPTSGVQVAKYVPPSLRRVGSSEEESKSRLRKQVQGLINRLTDANILSIVSSVEELYQKNARGDVTDIITDAIMAQICKPESLPDQFFVLTGGFAAATYRLIGASFGSQLIRRIVADFGVEYDRASQDTNGDPSGFQKETSNLITLLSQLYVFEVVSCRILFDYMEKLLSNLSELNVELLLRICRMAGRLMRRDDPQTLKHVAGVLSQAVSRVGYANISVRTKFMIDTITDLKNAKPKARGMDSAIVSEHVQRMKKRLGELKSQSRRLEGVSPMGIGLVDIEGAATRGKWWLVGASVPANIVNEKHDAKLSRREDEREPSDEEDMDFILPDYPQKARAQGLTGTAQIAIFTALMTAADFEQGYRQFLNLNLRKDDQLELARVLIQCVGSEAQYNPYYALVGNKACANSKLRFAFQDRLWKIFRGLGESLFGEGPDDDDTADGERMRDERRISNVAQFYASLITDGALSIAILRPLELPELNEWTSMFVERLVIALLQKCRGKQIKEDARVEKYFGPARDFPGLAAGIHWILRKKIRKTKLITTKEAKKLDDVRQKVQTAVQAVTAVTETS